MRRHAALVATVAAIAGLAVPRLHAHAGLRLTDPFEGAALGASPTEVRLSFMEKPEGSLSSIRVLDINGAAFHVGRPHPVAGDPLAIAVPVRTLPKGIYVVYWRVVSAVDGHATEGAFAFGVLMAPAGMPDTAATSPDVPSIEALARWLFVGGLVILLGAASANAARFGGASDLALGGAGWILAATGVVLLAVAQVRTAGAPFGDLVNSAIGRAQVWRAVAAAAAGAALLPAWLRPSVRRPAMMAAALAALSAMAVHVAAGHAGAASRWLWLPTVAAQWAHFAAAGIWLGGLAALLAGVRGGPSPEKAAAVRRFSKIALVALLVVAATGVARAIGELSTWTDLWTTWYGRAVSAKIALLLMIAALGAINRWRSVPLVFSTLRPLRLVGRGELAFAAGALAASAVLGTLPPPAAGVDRIRGLVATGSDFGTTIRVQLTAASDQPGSNRFVVHALDYDSAIPVGADRVSLRFTPLDDPGVPSTSLALKHRSDDSYSGTGANLAFDGRWRIAVSIQRGGSSVEIPLEVAVEGPPPFLAVDRTPGYKPVYELQLRSHESVRFAPAAERPGPTSVAVTFFDKIGDPIGMVDVVVTVAAGQGPARHVPIHRLDTVTFVADVDFQAGVNRVAAVGRMRNGTRLRAAFDLPVPEK